MITSLRFTNFKNFADETLRVGPFTVIVGANASGKSNIRDAFRFLHGIGRGYTLPEIFGGRYGVGGQPEWEPLRGGANEIIRFGQQKFSLQVEIAVRSCERLTYSITAGDDKARPGSFLVARECLEYRDRDLQRKIYTSHPGEGDPVHAQGDDKGLLIRMENTGRQSRRGTRIRIRQDQPALTQIGEHHYVVREHRHIAEQVINNLASIRFLDLVPDRMKRPAFPGQAVLGDSGENLPTVLREICEDPRRNKTLASWVRELTPMDVQDFEFPADPITGMVQLVFRETDDRKISAYAASDGTLRFVAMLAALLGNNPAGLYFFEEIDNGIHPARMHLLLDLIEGQTAKGKTRVVTTTHSPDMLSMVNDTTFENMSIVYRDEDSADSIIRPVSSLPNSGKLRKTQGLGRLHAGGWMETALAFTEGYDGE